MISVYLDDGDQLVTDYNGTLYHWHSLRPGSVAGLRSSDLVVRSACEGDLIFEFFDRVLERPIVALSESPSGYLKIESYA